MATIAIGISPKAGGGYSARVPVNSLEEGGVPPEEGDKVSFSVDATVQSVSGGTATIDIDAINGEPVSEEAAESPEEETGEEGEEGAPPAGAGGPGPGGTSSQADGTGRPIGAAPARPLSRMMTSKGLKPLGGMMIPGTGETTGAMGRRLRKAAVGRALGGY
jgi:hypothetical protein